MTKPVIFNGNPNSDNGDGQRTYQTVLRLERAERIIPSLRWAVTGAVALYALLPSGVVTGDTLMLIAFTFLASSLLTWVAMGLVFRPVRTLSYRQIAKRLSRAVALVAGERIQTISWYQFSPGAVALCPFGGMVLCDRSTTYEMLRLTSDQIVGVKVERERTVFTTSRHSGRMMIGGSHSGVMGGYVGGGRSTSVSREREQAYLEIQYHAGPGDTVRIVVIPFGENRRGADAVCATLRHPTSRPIA